MAGLFVSIQANSIHFTGLRFDPPWSSATRSMIVVIPVDGPLHLCLPVLPPVKPRRYGPIPWSTARMYPPGAWTYLGTVL